MLPGELSGDGLDGHTDRTIELVELLQAALDHFVLASLLPSLPVEVVDLAILRADLGDQFGLGVVERDGHGFARLGTGGDSVVWTPRGTTTAGDLVLAPSVR